MGLAVGIVATAILQSSTAVTAIIVALTAGGLPVPIAVPMIMGSNRGTTLTNSIVSLVIVVLGIPFLRKLPVMFAEWLSGLAAER